MRRANTTNGSGGLFWRSPDDQGLAAVFSIFFFEPDELGTHGMLMPGAIVKVWSLLGGSDGETFVTGK